jgi:hypothetical protein
MKHIRRILAAVATLAGALLALAAASPAYASRPHFGRPVSSPTQVHVIATGGMPGWQITLIAVGAALAAAAVAVLLDRARMARKADATTA